MKKLEQTILIILIVTCVGMCAGSLLIALSRNNNENNDPYVNTTQKISYTQSQEVEIEKVMNSQVYRGIMHGLEFPHSFMNNTRFLTTELERFYFVFESLRLQSPDRVSCVSLSLNAAPSECRFLESDFQNLAQNIFGEEILFSSISSDYVRRSDGFITCDYDARLDQSAYILKFHGASLTGSIHEIQLEMYTSIQEGNINYDEIKNFVDASYISHQNLFGTLKVQFKVQDDQNIITAISFEKV